MSQPMTDQRELLERLEARKPSAPAASANEPTELVNPDGPEAAALIRSLEAALSEAESEARRYAESYPPSSDGRNTFVMLADRINSLAHPAPSLSREEIAEIIASSIIGQPSPEAAGLCAAEAVIAALFTDAILSKGGRNG